MKKVLIALIMGSISFSALIECLNAQGTSNPVAFTETKPFIKPAIAPNSAAAANVNTRAVKDFRGRFTSASEENWVAVHDGYISYFKMNGFGCRAYYDKKGRWEYSLTYFGEDKLPHDLRAIIKSTYFDFNITLIEEVETTEAGVYLVHLEDQTSIKIVKINKDGEMELMQEFIKG
jgi:hypothetical protein